MGQIRHPDIDKLLLEPNLLVPGKKPVGPVELHHTDHNNIIGYWLINRPGLTVLDISKEKNSGTTDSYIKRIGSQGLCLDFSVGDHYAAFTGNELTNFSYFLLVEVGSRTTSETIATMAESPGAIGFDRNTYIDSSGYPSFRIYDGTGKTVSDANAVSEGDLLAIVVTSDGSEISITVNGRRSTTAAGDAYTGYATPEFVLGYGYRTTLGDLNLYSLSKIYMAGYLNKALSPTAAISLSNDIYQHLKPAIYAPIYFPEVAAGGFQPAWAVNANQLIQSGGTMT